jgi:hypothetical protein
VTGGKSGETGGESGATGGKSGGASDLPASEAEQTPNAEKGSVA